MQRIFIIAGPTNAGKDTIMKQLLLNKSLNLSKIITSTSRPIRNGETNGIDYYFYTKAEFEDMVAKNDFFEWALVHNEYKGIQKKSIYENRFNERDLILQVDIQGFLKLKQSLNPQRHKLVGIFIMPPSMEELKRRMKIRNTETDPTDIETRLKNAEIEIKNKDIFDYVVINDDLRKCIDEVKNIIRKEQNN